MAPRTASTAAVIAIVSLLLRFMADPFLTRISILAPESGTAYHTPILDPPKRRSFCGAFFCRCQAPRKPASVSSMSAPTFQKTKRGAPAITWATRPPLLLVPRDRGRTSPLPRGAAVAALAVPLFRYPQKQFVGNPDGSHNL